MMPDVILLFLDVLFLQEDGGMFDFLGGRGQAHWEAMIR